VAEGKAQLLHAYDIDVITLGQLFADYVGQRPVDLLSLDMEGLDADVITTFNFATARPVTICIEANHAMDRSKMLTYLNRQDYRLAIELGCNLIVEDSSRRQ
jgi:hypothetical protein